MALVALAIFLVFLVYLGWDGGEAGGALVDGLRRLVGAVHYVVPVALLASGALLVMRPALPAVRPFRAAGACLLVAGCLGLAAGTLGLGSGQEMEDRGGVVGDRLYELTSTLVGDVGSHIIAVFLFLAGVLLLTGASVASVLKVTGDSVTTTGRKLRQGAEPVRTAVIRRRSPRDELAVLEEAEVTAVTRADPHEFWSGAERFPDLYDGAASPDAQAAEPAAESPDDPPASPEPRLAEDPETDEPGVMRGGRDVKPEDLTPQGRLRRSVTDKPEFVWSVPDPRFLTRSTADANRPDTAGQEKVAAQLVEALGHFGVEARVIGMVAGPQRRDSERAHRRAAPRVGGGPRRRGSRAGTPTTRATTTPATRCCRSPASTISSATAGSSACRPTATRPGTSRCSSGSTAARSCSRATPATSAGTSTTCISRRSSTTPTRRSRIAPPAATRSGGAARASSSATTPSSGRRCRRRPTRSSDGRRAPGADAPRRGDRARAGPARRRGVGRAALRLPAGSSRQHGVVDAGRRRTARTTIYDMEPELVPLRRVAIDPNTSLPANYMVLAPHAYNYPPFSAWIFWLKGVLWHALDADARTIPVPPALRERVRAARAADDGRVPDRQHAPDARDRRLAELRLRRAAGARRDAARPRVRRRDACRTAAGVRARLRVSRGDPRRRALGAVRLVDREHARVVPRLVARGPLGGRRARCMGWRW